MVEEQNILQTEITAEVIETATKFNESMFTANNVWMMIATALVFIMHLGFAGVEAGFG